MIIVADASLALLMIERMAFAINQGGIAGVTRPWLTSQGAFF